MIRGLSFLPSSASRAWLTSVFAALLVFVVGCGTTPSDSGPGVSQPAATIAASPASIAAGATSTLTVTAANATAVTVSGSDGSSYTMATTGGTQAVTPAATTTYTVTATGASGTTAASGTTTVTVTSAPATAPTVTMTASPTSITAGGTSTLTVTATNATTGVTISGSDGSSYTLGMTGGTKVVTPSATTTYTATATGATGTTAATATATVTVTATTPAPTVSIAANPATIATGGSSSLTIVAANATAVTVTGSDGTSYTLSGTGGVQPVAPTTTTTYTATATGTAGTATAMATVTVTPNPLPTVTINANPTAIDPSSSSILAISATNATTVTISGSDGSSYTLASTGGKQAVSPTSTTTYTVTATGAGGSVTASTTVTVTANPEPTITISASPSSIIAGSSSTLTVSAVNATSITVTGTDGSSYTLGSSSAVQTVTPSTTTSYTATATGPGGTATASTTVTVAPVPAPTVTIAANPTTVVAGSASTLAVTATNATTVMLTGADGSSYTLTPTGGSQSVTPASTTVYTASATGNGGSTTAQTTVTVTPAGSLQSINHVIFMLQENHTFDNYFGMLNPYRAANGYNVGADGNTYNVDGIDDKLNTISNEDDEGQSFPLFKLQSTCVDDMTSSWLESYGQVNRYDFSTNRTLNMDGFVHTSENYAKNCSAGSGQCAGTFSDFTGQRAMGYYDQEFLNYYYYMASQFALSDRWFSPVSSKTVDNRIATETGGTTQGLVFDPNVDDGLNTQLTINSIYQELDTAGVSWKIYYTVTEGGCTDEDDCPTAGSSVYPATTFSELSYSYQYLYTPQKGAACAGTTQPSSVVGDTTNSFCIDPHHIAPLSQYYTDLANGTLPSYAFIEAGYGVNDEHPGSGQSVLIGQQESAKVMNALMASSSWGSSVLFFGYDEGGGPYDHVPPVAGSSNMNTDATLGSIPISAVPDIGSIAVNPDQFNPCLPANVGTPTLHCDLGKSDPGAAPTDAAAVNGFKAQLGFRVPNMVISPFVRKHYVSHIPMDHTAILKFVENRFIGPNAHLTDRDQAQPNLLDFFDFTNTPWATPPATPTPYSDNGASCTPTTFAPAVSGNASGSNQSRTATGH